jgi:long-subunit fatty acid transport protein
MEMVKMNIYKKHGWIMILILPIFLLFNTKSNAVQMEAASSLNPVGSGARATGMGGAFIGVADDATAASWNPAGLILLEKPEISAVYSYSRRKQNYNSEIHPEIAGENTMDSDGLNYASAAFPFVLINRNMIVSFNYQRLYEMNKDIYIRYDWDFDGDNVYETPGSVAFEQSGYLYTLSPAMAVQVLPELYFGATFNRWGDILNKWDSVLPGNGWHSTTDFNLDYTYVSDVIDLTMEKSINSVVEEEASFEGKNWHFGFLWAINSSFTLGGVYKTPFDADVERKRKETMLEITDTYLMGTHTHEEKLTDEPASTEYLTWRMPASYGLGLSYRHSDSLTVALDVYITDWSRFVIRDEKGNEKNPISGENIHKGRLKDTTQVRLGTEYLFIKEKYMIPVRFGLFYDPEPATNHLNDFYGFSIGTGFARGRFVLDTAYQYRKGNDVVSEDVQFDITRHSLMLSAIFYL